MLGALPCWQPLGAWVHRGRSIYRTPENEGTQLRSMELLGASLLFQAVSRLKGIAAQEVRGTERPFAGRLQFEEFNRIFASGYQ